MCGITLFISRINCTIIPQLIKSLKAIENRGYDSAGIGIYIDNKWKIFKSIDKNSILDLEKQVEKYYSIVGIGHTRWATHGGINILNCHPHISKNKKIIVIHNGIINNYNYLKMNLKENHYYFYSQTDTEIIANFLEFILKTNKSLSTKEAIEILNNKLDGTWALAIINTDEPENIYITKNGSPLLLGITDEIIIATSETSGFNSQINNYITLESKDIIKLNKDNIDFNKTYKIQTIPMDLYKSTCEPYPNFTIKEINEQVESVLNAINHGGRINNNKIYLGGLKKLSQNLINNYYEHLIIIGSGSSYHASMMAKYYFSELNLNKFITIQSFDACEFSELDLPKQGKCVIIFCSQSGETHDVIKSINICKNYNHFLIGVVNVVDSCISSLVDCGVYMNAGKEYAVASTKSFTNNLIVLSLIGMYFKNKNNEKQIQYLRNLSSKIYKVLNNDVIKKKIIDYSNYIINYNIYNIFILGYNSLFPISKEIALKIKEITYIHCEAFSALSLKHGPFSLLDDSNVTFLLIDKKNYSILESTYLEIIARNTICFVITDSIEFYQQHYLENENDILLIDYLEYYNEIIFNVIMQYFAYSVAIKKEINPDKPRNLAKVVTVQ